MAQTNSGQALSEVSNALLLQFENTTWSVWESVECGNSFYQETLDRFIAGENVPEEDVQHVWRDTTQSPVAFDSPACEDFLNEVRSINLKLPQALRLRVLAGDPPIDWAKINSAEEFQKLLRSRDEFAAELVRREVLGKKNKALLIYGAGHFWRNNALIPTPNLATLLDGSNPGRLFTVTRLGGIYPDTTRLEAAVPKSRPAFLALRGTPAADLDANEFIGRGVPYPPDPIYAKEKQRRRAFMPQPRR